MNHWIVRVIVGAIAALLRIRYRIRYEGLDEIQKALKSTSRGTLFLPNHPAVFIDPLACSIPLLRFFSIRPLIIEYMYYNPLFYPFLRRIKALPIPNFATGFNPIKLKRVEKELSEISQGLKERSSFLIYPSGTTKKTAQEHIGGAFGVHKLIHENPDCNIVLIRMTGLWGSSFSRAFTQGEPIESKKVFKNALWTVCKNLIFFVPKRTVTLTFELAPDNFPRYGTKQEINQFLEEWYNRPFGKDGEPLTLVPYSFFCKKDVPEVTAVKSEQFDMAQVPKEVQDAIVAKLSELSKMPSKHILPSLLLVEHLGLDSLDMAELVSFLEEKFQVAAIAPEDLTSVQRLFMIAIGAYIKKEVPEKSWNLRRWFKKRPHIKLSYPQANTIPEAFFKSSYKRLFSIACADPRMGLISHYKLRKTVLVLTDAIKKMPGKRIGILLPASPMAIACVIACQYAGKTPVMINWTVGGKHLDTVMDVAEIQVVLSSWAFLDHLENVDLSRVDSHLKVLEEIRAEVCLWNVLKASLRAFCPVTSFSHLHEDDEAVVLFTSGTEGLPKGVPLTHANILSNQRAAIEQVALFEDDMLLSFLPPFHSFGFSITGILPFVAGLRTVFYPNPTDAARLAKAIEQWQVTVLCSAPTFLKNIFLSRAKTPFEKVRLIITGAEKTTEELFSLFRATCPEAIPYEGYGITECAPVLSVNTSGDKTRGVGRPLSNVQIRIVNPENMKEERKPNEVGMIIAFGPNIFSGYLNASIHSPFIETDGKQWYQTGDLGMKTDHGDLIISGRLKRFVKLGGEMVSLGAIEEALLESGIGSTKKTDEVQFAIDARGDLLGKAKLVLFSVHKLEVSDVNQVLRKYGFSNLVKIDSVVVVDEIPLTATGKVAYRQLEQLDKGT